MLLLLLTTAATNTTIASSAAAAGAASGPYSNCCYQSFASTLLIVRAVVGGFTDPDSPISARSTGGCPLAAGLSEDAHSCVLVIGAT